MRALIDCDILMYKAGFAAENRDWVVMRDGEPWMITKYSKDAIEFMEHMCPEGVCTKVQNRIALNPEIAFDRFESLLADILSACGTKEYLLFITSGRGNFRYEVATTKPYKGNRKPDAKPLCYKKLLDYVRKIHPCSIELLQEADDGMGIAQTDDTIICTIDKDLDMIPGRHYNFDKDKHYEISRDQGLQFFYTQLITGDSTDNITGIPKKGISAARKALKDIVSETEMYEIVREMYIKAELPPRYFLEQARLLWIRQEEDELWQPPHE